MILDLIIIVLLIGGLISGYRAGFINQSVRIVSLILSFMVAIYYFQPTANIMINIAKKNWLCARYPMALRVGHCCFRPSVCTDTCCLYHVGQPLERDCESSRLPFGKFIAGFCYRWHNTVFNHFLCFKYPDCLSDFMGSRPVSRITNFSNNR